MRLGSGELGMALGLAVVVMPVALYFLILGLLNSRPHPQLIRGRRDFALLVIALGPVFVLPAMNWFPDAWVGLAAACAAVAGGAMLLAPPQASWVVYNIAPAEARRAIGRALRAAGLDFRPQGRSFCLSATQAVLHVSDFSLLRNVSIRWAGAAGDAPRQFEAALARALHLMPAETTPMTMALLLVATAMLVAPLALMAPQVPQIVRLLTGLLY